MTSLEEQVHVVASQRTILAHDLRHAIQVGWTDIAECLDVVNMLPNDTNATLLKCCDGPVQALLDWLDCFALLRLLGRCWSFECSLGNVFDGFIRTGVAQ